MTCIGNGLVNIAVTLMILSWLVTIFVLVVLGILMIKDVWDV